MNDPLFYIRIALVFISLFNVRIRKNILLCYDAFQCMQSTFSEFRRSCLRLDQNSMRRKQSFALFFFKIIIPALSGLVLGHRPQQPIASIRSHKRNVRSFFIEVKVNSVFERLQKQILSALQLKCIISVNDGLVAVQQETNWISEQLWKRIHNRTNRIFVLNNCM